MRLELPWPPKELNPNGRLHWAKKLNFTKNYKWDCYVLAKANGDTPQNFDDLTLTLCPPDKRRRDDDNMIGAFKAGRDGVAQAWKVDDSVFRFTYKIGEPVKGGAVVITGPESRKWNDLE